MQTIKVSKGVHLKTFESSSSFQVKTLSSTPLLFIIHETAAESDILIKRKKGKIWCQYD
jgi:hypothetical protein